jgi:uncharacterized membrane protein
MGFDRNSSRFLATAASAGVDFSRTLTLGRQYMHVSPGQLLRHLHRINVEIKLTDLKQRLQIHNDYAEPYLALLGAKETDSLDASAYEGATHIHDLNQPIPEVLKNRYTTVIDSGTLEHVFNFPVAIKNCMEMVAVGGHFLCITPANNFMGHGFYQFSPELFFRLFVAENGFQMEQLLLYREDGMWWYEVTDPDSIRQRVELVNCTPAYIGFRARKIRQVETILAVAPQQSDYAAQWQDAAASDHNTPGLAQKLRLLRQKLPDFILVWAFFLFWRLRRLPLTLYNHKFYRRIRL